MIHYVLIGLLAGISIGILGIGGGTITIPLLLFSGLNIRAAVGVSLVMLLLPQSIGGVYLYNKKKYINWTISLLVVLGSFFGIILGSRLVTKNIITEKLTYKLYTLLMVVITAILVKEHLLAPFIA